MSRGRKIVGLVILLLVLMMAAVGVSVKLIVNVAKEVENAKKFADLANGALRGRSERAGRQDRGCCKPPRANATGDRLDEEHRALHEGVEGRHPPDQGDAG